MTTIVIAEDNYADAVLLREALRASGVEARYLVIEDGALVMGRLQALATARTLPDLIILDLHLPHLDGVELLRCIRAHAQLKDVHTVIVTGCGGNQERGACAAADGYLLKGADWDESLKLAKALAGFLPQAAAPG
jgi:CheY-like chemotaxis protein